MFDNPFFPLALLAAAAVISPVFSRSRFLAGVIHFVFIAAGAVMLIGFSANILLGHPYEHTVHIGPIAVPFLADGLSAVFITVIAVLSIASSFYSIKYMEHYREYSAAPYYIAFPLFIAGMIGVVTVDDLSFGFTAAWQIMTLASYFLIRFEHRERANVASANKYLILMELAYGVIIGATLFVHGIEPGDSVAVITGKIAATDPIRIIAVFALLFAGFGCKAGVFPLGQLWLPDAHSVAPSPVSAMLSGVMLKTGIYGLLRTFFWMIPHDGVAGFSGYYWGIGIAVMGAVTLFIGTVQSMKQNDAKRLLAYSSIGQLGYIIFAIGAALAMIHSTSAFVQGFAVIALIGAVYHVINHAVFKWLLFLTSGSVLYATGTKDLSKLGGLMKFMPVTAVLAFIASLAIAGIPPLSGFASKWTIVSSSLLAGSEVGVLVVAGIIALFTSTITLAAYVKFFGMSFASAGSEWNVSKPIREVPVMLLLPKIALALIICAQGFFPAIAFTLITRAFATAHGSIVEALFTAGLGERVSASSFGVIVSVPGMNGFASAAVPLVIIAVVAGALLVGWFIKRAGGSTEKRTTAWLCGYQELNDKNRYASANMFSAFKKAFWWAGGNVKK